MRKTLFSIVTFFALAFAAQAQSIPPRTVTPAPPQQLDSYRTGFAPSVVYRVNRAETDPVDWLALPGEATIDSANAPDSTQGAGTLSTTLPGTQYKRVTALTRNFAAGDWLVYGVWVKASSLGSPTAGATASMDRYAVGMLSISDGTNSFRLDSGAYNFKYVRTSTTAETRWEWVTGAAKVTSLSPTTEGELRFDLLCDNTHAVTFYAPTLQIVDAGTMTDAEVLASLLNLYPIPDGASQGGLALLKYQKLWVPQISDGATTQMVTVGATGLLAAQAIPGGGGGSVSSVFGRTGAVIAATNDYTWAQIDKSTSSLADITTRSAADLSSGTLPDARFPATLPALNGSALTNLNASNLASGTAGAARGGTGLDTSGSTGVPRINAGTWSADANLSHLQSSTSANLATVLSNETGTGLVVFNDTPTLVAPILGTPTSVTLTNATGLPVATGISGLGTGVATALAINTGSAGAVVLFNGALGTPSSGTLTNATGLPVSTGISGLGANVATFLATPSSANLATALTGETGSGAAMFGTTPTATNATIQQAANGDTGLYGQRFTDTTPTGYLFRFRNAAATTDLTYADVAGALFSQSITTNSDITIGRHLVGASPVPTLSVGTGAGTGATTDIAGTDSAGWIQINTGSTPSSSARVFTITFSAAFTGQGFMILVPVNANAAALTGGKVVYISDTDRAAGSMQGWVGSTALTASTTYEFYYLVIG
jgi:hypothetical protein